MTRSFNEKRIFYSPKNIDILRAILTKAFRKTLIRNPSIKNLKSIFTKTISYLGWTSRVGFTKQAIYQLYQWLNENHLKGAEKLVGGNESDDEMDVDMPNLEPATDNENDIAMSPVRQRTPSPPPRPPKRSKEEIDIDMDEPDDVDIDMDEPDDDIEEIDLVALNDKEIEREINENLAKRKRMGRNRDMDIDKEIEQEINENLAKRKRKQRNRDMDIDMKEEKKDGREEKNEITPSLRKLVNGLIAKYGKEKEALNNSFHEYAQYVTSLTEGDDMILALKIKRIAKTMNKFIKLTSEANRLKNRIIKVSKKRNYSTKYTKKKFRNNRCS